MVTNPVTVRAELTFYALKVYLDDTLHLYVKRREFVGFQAWKDGPHRCCIEVTVKQSVPILVEYDDPTKWATVLAHLNAALK